MSNLRSHRRHPVDLTATVEVQGQDREGTFRNMSLGGAFLVVDLGDRELPMGERVQVSFRIPTQDETISVGASVRWISEEGVGLQFDGLRAREVWSLNKYFERLAG